MKQMANFTGGYLGSNLPGMNLTDLVRIVFSTQTDKGEGWSAKFYISSPDIHDRKLIPEIFIVAIMGLVVITLASTICI